MNFRGDVIKLTVFSVSCLLVGYVLYATLARTQFGPTRDYSAVLTNASGLQSGDLVKIAGVRVGKVGGVRLIDGNRIKVRFTVSEKTVLTDRTQFMVRYENLLGDRYAELAQAPAQGTRLKPGATIPVDRTRPALDLDVLMNGFKPLFNGLEPDQVNQLANNLIATFQGRGGTVRSLLEQTSSLTNGLADDDKTIGSLVTNLNSLLGSLDDHDGQLRTTITQLRSVVSGLSGDRDPIAQSIGDIADLTDRLNALFTDVRKPFKSTTIAVKDLADLLNTNRKTLNKVLSQLPAAYELIDRVGSHGTFFNFYLCSAQVKISGPGGKPITTPVVRSQVERCNPK
jgi:phospholipid/cholesterol/gamma-HCH transport system substrate-binding protein